VKGNNRRVITNTEGNRRGSNERRVSVKGQLESERSISEGAIRDQRGVSVKGQLEIRGEYQ
jgi:hypothetical protein